MFSNKIQGHHGEYFDKKWTVSILHDSNNNLPAILRHYLNQCMSICKFSEGLIIHCQRRETIVFPHPFHIRLYKTN